MSTPRDAVENSQSFKITFKKRKREPSAPAPRLKFAELFSGIGGGRVALEKGLNLEPVFASEIHSTARTLYELNFGDVPEGDITKIETKDIPDFDFLVAGFPCQSFSLAGGVASKRGLKGKTGNLFFEVVRVLKEKQPSLFLLENVDNIAKLQDGKALKIILGNLEEAGYYLKTAILDSYNFGTPQHRLRWYCVGFKKDLDWNNGETFEKYFQFPLGNPSGMAILDILEDTLPKSDKLKPQPGAVLDMLSKHINNTKSSIQQQEKKYEVDSSEKNKTALVKAIKEGVHQPFLDRSTIWSSTAGIKISRKGTTSAYSTYSADSILQAGRTLTALAHANNLVELGRRFSPRELARLQTFPDNYIIPNDIKTVDAEHCFGNSFTVSVIQAIAKNLVTFYLKHSEGRCSELDNASSAPIVQKRWTGKVRDTEQLVTSVTTTLKALDVLQDQACRIKRLKTEFSSLTVPLDTISKLDTLKSGPGTFEFADLNCKDSDFQPKLPKKQLRNLSKPNLTIPPFNSTQSFLSSSSSSSSSLQSSVSSLSLLPRETDPSSKKVLSAKTVPVKLLLDQFEPVKPPMERKEKEIENECKDNNEMIDVINPYKDTNICDHWEQSFQSYFREFTNSKQLLTSSNNSSSNSSSTSNQNSEVTPMDCSESEFDYSVEWPNPTSFNLNSGVKNKF